MAVKHYGMFEFNEGTTEADIKECFDALSGMVGKIPGLQDVISGPYESPEGLNDDYTHGFIMTFDSPESRDAYLPHPEHEVVKQRILAMLDGGVDCVVAFDWLE